MEILPKISFKNCKGMVDSGQKTSHRACYIVNPEACGAQFPCVKRRRLHPRLAYSCATRCPGCVTNTRRRDEWSSEEETSAFLIGLHLCDQMFGVPDQEAASRLVIHTAYGHEV